MRVYVRFHFLDQLQLIFNNTFLLTERSGQFVYFSFVLVLVVRRRCLRYHCGTAAVVIRTCVRWRLRNAALLGTKACVVEPKSERGSWFSEGYVAVVFFERNVCLGVAVSFWKRNVAEQSAGRFGQRRGEYIVAIVVSAVVVRVVGVGLDDGLVIAFALGQVFQFVEFVRYCEQSQTGLVGVLVLGVGKRFVLGQDVQQLQFVLVLMLH